MTARGMCQLFSTLSFSILAPSLFNPGEYSEIKEEVLILTLMNPEVQIVTKISSS